MMVIFYLQVLVQISNIIAISKHTKYKGFCVQNNMHVEPSFIRELCRSNPHLEEFMVAADILIRSDCYLIDSCRRVVEQPNADEEEVDFVVVGGGVAGPVIAGRLSENPNWTVTLLESGPEQPAATDIPALLSSAISTKYDWKYSTVPQKNACLAYGGVCGWPRGKVLGGTAVLSGSMYSRGHRSIYDRWLKNGNPGWGYDDVLPFFKMSENNRDYGTSQVHGTGGPIPVQMPTDVLPISRTLIEAGKELGYEHIDMSEADPMGFSLAQAMISPARTRVTMATAYLRPHLRSRRNLRVKINCHATRLLVNAATRTVYGVEYVDRTNNTRRLLVRKEVILSAGVIGSPHLLMVSGIGPAEDLAPLGIRVVQDLRVGYNLQHHVASRLGFRLNVTHDRQLSYEALGQYLKLRAGPLSTTGGLQVSAFLRSDRVGPTDPADVQLFFDGFAPNCAYAQPAYGCTAPAELVRMNVRPVNLMPLSRGTIRLASADPFVRPKIDPNYLAEDADVEPLVWGLKLASRLIHTRALQKLGATMDTTAAEHCQQHTFATDPYWRCLIRYHTRGENHHAGTCKMGPASDPGAVVDSQLKVHNVNGIRVVDASVLPLQPNSNPIAPIVMVAEKAARFIKDTWNR
ncbi:glucose dehydrogenase [FAD, quinone]-like isoform X3 [Sipha flava]|uniref:Glucose dehydrogenase [FAD, quinone]-like isoform X3 n=1 Tax=Sipha flava TaxID=143950 RepID=A0A8B8GI15_9HEMI|nr:glucose dehydrogenase [FAD, quinone]-like isoform X3 [Sipha flava]